MSYYDRDGRPMELMEWAAVYETGAIEKRVARDEMPDGAIVSTVWLGLDHSFGAGPPLIFETMVFPSPTSGAGEDYCERYSTEEQALAGHQRIVEEWKVIHRLGMNLGTPPGVA